jgi:hypothetical protein
MIHTDAFGNPYPRRLRSQMRPMKMEPGRTAGATIMLACLNTAPDPLIAGSGFVKYIANTSGGIVAITIACGPDRRVLYSDNVAPGSPVQLKSRFDDGLFITSPSQPQVQLTVELL